MKPSCPDPTRGKTQFSTTLDFGWKLLLRTVRLKLVAADIQKQNMFWLRRYC